MALSASCDVCDEVVELDSAGSPRSGATLTVVNKSAGISKTVYLDDECFDGLMDEDNTDVTLNGLVFTE